MYRQRQAALLGAVRQHARTGRPCERRILAIFAVPSRVRDLDRLVHDITDEQGLLPARSHTDHHMPGRVPVSLHKLDAVEQFFCTVNQLDGTSVQNWLNAVDKYRM